MPPRKVTNETTTGTHSGIENGHKGTRSVGSGLEVLVEPETGAAVVVVITGGLGRLLIFVKMKGLA